ncbi:replicase [Entoleuca phenui-like virus 1]|uniref:RNA-directed RNA polymerase L n=1 Tax=Entoleuca phenui-like virus 1 TaxID=2086640 RepID=A0A2L1GGA6_9VIRU|nr:replicase [Entoleuca phenui-like virus 1]AVD68666.1 replicase [Entoleuca phenui-like virus 1]
MNRMVTDKGKGKGVLRHRAFLSSSHDITKLLDKPRVISATPIEDPHVLKNLTNASFDIEVGDIDKTLHETFLEKGGKPEQATGDDYLYHYKAKVVVDQPGVVEVGRKKIELVINARDQSFQDMAKLRHDFVANRMTGETDVPFQEIGVNSIQTPDFIDKSSRTVIELTTNASGTMKSLESSYIAKRIQYESICEQHQLNFIILVVGAFSVMTNTEISQEEVDELTLRCRIGLNLEAILSEKMDMRFYSEDDITKSHKYLRGIYSDWSHDVNLPENPHFDQELNDLDRPLSEQEEEHVQRILKTTLSESLRKLNYKGNPNAMEEYLSRYNGKNSRKSKSQITIFPMLYQTPERYGQRGTFEAVTHNVNVPTFLWDIMQHVMDKPDLMMEYVTAANNKRLSYELANEVETSMSSKAYNKTPSRAMPKHKLRQSFTFTPFLSQDQVKRLALKGVGAKSLQNDHDVLAKEAFKKLSFHPDAPVDDIARFWNREWEDENDEIVRAKILGDDAVNLVLKTKASNTLNLEEEPESIRLFENALCHPLSRSASFISDLCTEIAMEYKVPTREDEWLVKPLRRHKCFVFLRCTGSHTFFFTMHPKASTTLIETGDIGPEIYECGNYWVTNISSITEPYIEHFMKAESYIPSILVHLMSSFKVPVTELDYIVPSSVNQTLSYIYLTYLNNKIDHEEMLTNLRFLYMKLFQECGANCNEYVDRLPVVMRSRLSVFTLGKIRSLMDYYSKHRILRKSISTPAGPVWEHKNLRVIYHSDAVTLEQLIDSFYFSYVISKEKSAMGDHSFHIFDKVVKEEWDYMDKVIKKGKKPWGLLDGPEKHRWDWALERKKLELCDSVLKDKHGPAYKNLIHNAVWRGVGNLSFSEKATLKASAKDYSDGIKKVDDGRDLTRKEYIEKYRQNNAKLRGKRPRVITRLKEMIDDYISNTGEKNPDYNKVALWVMDRCLERGILMSDLFQKDQHNGLREIHVLDILAKHIQSVAEAASKSICRFFENDTVCSPETKKSFYRNHIESAEGELGSNIMICKSADASKWCQRNHASQFYFQMKHYTPEELHPFLYCFYYLWTQKRIALPPELLRNLDVNRDVQSSNDNYKRMMADYHAGNYPFLEPRGTFIKVSSGMFQGILHDASCLKHDIAQTAWKRLSDEFMMTHLKTRLVTTIVQGSDDSAALVSCGRKNMGILAFIIILLWWKEMMSAYSGIWCSEAKSSIGTVSLLEYNSEWYMNGRIVKPCFRWVSACMSVSFTERFTQRVEQFYNGVTQCVESGTPLLTCAVIQMNQALLHYRMIGIGTHPLSRDFCHMSMSTRNPSLGYFPLELDQICGLAGFDYQLYLLTRAGVKVQNWEMEERESDKTISYDDKVMKIVKDSVRHYSLRMSSIKSYLDVLKATSLPRVESLLKKVEQNPEMLYGKLHTWEQEQLKMAMTLDNQSVKLSLSSHQPLARLMSASAYILNTPCITSNEEGVGKIKKSLWKWLTTVNSCSEIKLEESGSQLGKNWFVNQDQYDEFTRFIGSMRGMVSYQQVHLRRADKVEIVVWGSRNDVEVPILDLVKRQWFRFTNVKCSRTAFMNLWKAARQKYPFLRDTYQETKEVMGMEDISIYRILQAISSKTRIVRLSDSSAKGKDLWSVASRIYWPDVKVRSNILLQEVGIRELKNAIHCLTTYFYKKQYILTECKKLIENNTVLDRMDTFTLDSAYKLKIFQSFLKGESKWSLISKIEKSRQGVIGYFSKRQSRTNTGYKGEGIWIGLINNIPCKLIMFNREIHTVVVQRISDTSIQMKAIKNLIREFGLKYPKSGPKSESRLYIPEIGNVRYDEDRPENSAKLLVDKTFNPDVKTKILDQDWELDADDASLKLVFRTDAEGELNVRYTILSETYGHNCWDALLPAPDVPDKNFQNWCHGIPCQPLTLLEQMMIPLEKGDLVTMKGLLEKKRFYRPDNIYDISKFLRMMHNSLGRKIYGHSFNDFISDEIDKKDELIGDKGGFKPTMEQIMAIQEDSLLLMKTFNSLEEEQNPKIAEENKKAVGKMAAAFGFDDAEDGGEDEYDPYDSSWDDDEEMLMDGKEGEIWEMFGNDDPVLAEMKERAKKTFIGNVQQIEMFLNPLHELIRDRSNNEEVMESFHDMGREDPIEVSGPIGAILYLMYPQFEYVKGPGSDLEKVLEVSSVGEFSSISSSRGGMPVDVSTLLLEKEQLKTTIDIVQEPLKSTLLLRLERINREIEYSEKLNQIESTRSELIQLNKMVFMGRLLDEVENKGFWAEGINHHNKQVRIEFLITNIVEKLDQQVAYGMMSAASAEAARVGAWSSVLTPDFVIAACLYLNSRIFVSIKGKTIFGYRKSYLTNDIDVNF